MSAATVTPIRPDLRAVPPMDRDERRAELILLADGVKLSDRSVSMLVTCYASRLLSPEAVASLWKSYTDETDRWAAYLRNERHPFDLDPERAEDRALMALDDLLDGTSEYESEGVI